MRTHGLVHQRVHLCVEKQADTERQDQIGERQDKKRQGAAFLDDDCVVGIGAELERDGSKEAVAAKADEEEEEEKEEEEGEDKEDSTMSCQSSCGAARRGGN